MITTFRAKARGILRNPTLVRILRSATRVLPVIPGNSTAPPSHILVAPPGAGNIGDQAMVEAFIENVREPVIVICRKGSDFYLTESADCKIIDVPGLIYGSALSHARSVYRFRNLLRGALSVSVVGADTMDGNYNLNASLNRAGIAELAARSGVDSRILGFSWSPRADPRATNAVRRAAKSGVGLYLRDPISAERVREFCAGGVKEAADIVFSARSADDSIFDYLKLDPASKYAVVNSSALIGAGIDQRSAYVKVVSTLQDSGLSVVLVPHVSRAGSDDKLELSKIFDGLSEDIYTLDKLATPSEIRALVTSSHLVITGRMHLGVISLSRCVPAVILGSQGKVEGLMSLLGISDLYVDPNEEFAQEMVRAVERAIHTNSEVRRRVNANLPAVRELSIKNFAGLAAK